VRVKVLFFGQLKDIVGLSEDELQLNEQDTAGSAFQYYAERFPQIAALSESIVVARNHAFTPRSTPLADGDEIALLPPVSGGLGSYSHLIKDEGPGNFFALTRDPVDTREISAALLRGEDGAVVTFDGVVRNNSKGRRTRYLDYECYEPMAIKILADLGRDIASSHAIGRIAIVHRLGIMNIGETSVAIVVTAPHRKPAFEAALEGINRLKRTVPIWKKEYFEDGEVWVEGEWDQSIKS
jgi:molybdopterin converting factor subunit 1